MQQITDGYPSVSLWNRSVLGNTDPRHFIQLMPRNVKHRSWTFTSYNNLEFRPYQDNMVQYCICQKERCPQTGREHIQGYIYTYNPTRMASIQTYLQDNTAHLEHSKGNPQQNKAYCSKLESRVDGPWEYGTCPAGQGHRTDWDGLITDLKSGNSIESLARNHTNLYIRYHSGIKSTFFHIHTPTSNFRQVETSVYWGETGTGKTRRAVEENDSYYILTNSQTGVWFDGYNSEACLIIDEFYGWVQFGTLLRILDGYKFQAKIHGGFVWANWNKVIITSNKEPNEWYDWNKFSERQKQALFRRFSNIVYFE